MYFLLATAIEAISKLCIGIY